MPSSAFFFILPPEFLIFNISTALKSCGWTIIPPAQSFRFSLHFVGCQRIRTLLFCIWAFPILQPTPNRTVIGPQMQNDWVSIVLRNRVCFSLREPCKFRGRGWRGIRDCLFRQCGNSLSPRGRVAAGRWYEAACGRVR